MKGTRIILGFFALAILIFSAYAVLRTVPINECGDNGTGIECIGLPPGFSIDYYAEGVEGARSMALSPEGTLFAGSRGAGKCLKKI